MTLRLRRKITCHRTCFFFQGNSPLNLTGDYPAPLCMSPVTESCLLPVSPSQLGISVPGRLSLCMWLWDKPLGDPFSTSGVPPYPLGPRPGCPTHGWQQTPKDRDWAPEAALLWFLTGQVSRLLEPHPTHILMHRSPPHCHGKVSGVQAWAMLSRVEQHEDCQLPHPGHRPSEALAIPCLCLLVSAPSAQQAVRGFPCRLAACPGSGGQRPLLTLAGPPAGSHGVALLWARTLVTPGHVDTAEGAEDAGTLRAFVNVCREEIQPS